jgi:hypothetical protein
MECPVCYESEAKCLFTCGHSFCKECTKMWYMKGKCSCPMCRAPMCFKGIIDVKKIWRREKLEEVYVDLVGEMFDELGDDYKDVLLQCIEVVQNRFEYVIHKHPKITLDELNFVLRVTWIDIDYLLNGPTMNLHPEPRTYEKYLMISKYEKKTLHIIRYYVSKSSNNDNNIMLPVFIHHWWYCLV